MVFYCGLIMKKNILFPAACLGILLTALLVWQMGWLRPIDHASRVKTGDVGSALPARVASQPHPSLAHVPTLASATSIPPSAAAHVLKQPKLLTEATLAPLRRAFVPLRFTQDARFPRGRQILLSNRLIVAPEKRQIPTAVSGTQSATRRNTTPFLIQLSQSVNEDTRKLLESAGAVLHNH